MINFKRRKGQGALEYLIIIAGVLTIAALVVYFLTISASSGQGRNIAANCQNAASQCKLKLAVDQSADCSAMCLDACTDESKGNVDIMSGTQLTTANCRTTVGSACYYCAHGNISEIYYGL